MIEAIIFDMDGLLIDSEPVWDEARSLMAAQVGVSWNKDDHKAVMGVSTHEWVSYMIKRLSLSMPAKEVEETIISTMRDLYSKCIPYLPGAVEAVALATAHYPTGLASGSPQKFDRYCYQRYLPPREIWCYSLRRPIFRGKTIT
jgi:beta-phosphoglucomutase-like phosphatase (HAD superfamily)